MSPPLLLGALGYARAALLAAVAGATGCASYTSDYAPPQDGRARVVWNDTEAVALLPGAERSFACDEAVDAAVAEPATAGLRGSGRVSGGTSVVIVGVAPLPGPGPVVHGGGGGRVAATPHASGGASGGAARGAKDLPKEMAAVLAVAAIVALPGITIGLAVGRPEPEEKVATAIDRVNAFNDLARLEGTPCTPGGGP